MIYFKAKCSKAENQKLEEEMCKPNIIKITVPLASSPVRDTWEYIPFNSKETHFCIDRHAEDCAIKVYEILFN